MSKRPLAAGSVVFVMVLTFFLLLNDSLFERNPVKRNAEGKKQIEGFLQDTFIQGYGVVSDYEYRENNKKISTELTLTNVHILVSDSTEDQINCSSKNTVYCNSENIASYNFKDTASYNFKDTASYNSKDIASYNSEDTASYNSKETASYNSKDTASYNSEDTASYNSEDTASYNSKDTASYNSQKNSFICIEERESSSVKHWKKVTRWGQKIIVYINKEETPSIGETIFFSGSLFFFESASNPGQFDAENFYKNRDTLFAVKKAVLEKQTGNKDLIRQELKEFAEKQERVLDYFLSDSHASVIKAMLLGNKKELDQKIKELYQHNGIAHILAISGLHISLLGMTVYKLLCRLPIPLWISLMGSEIFLLLYGCMVGFSASSFRAIVMFSLFLLSKICKRSYDMITAAAVAAILQLLIHPGYILDCGFQLSYLAIGGIGILLPVFQEWIKLIPSVWMQKIISLLLPSLSVTLLTAPVLIYHYHEISFFSILLNVIVIPFVGILLQTAIVMLIASRVCLPLAWLCTILIRMILEFYEGVCRILELFPIGQKNIAHPSILIILIYYFLLFIMTILVKKKRNWYQFLFPLLSLSLLLFPKTPEFSVWMLDVGQGDCSVIFSGEGNCFVIDCGSTSEYHVGEKRLIPFLKYHGVGKVDAVFVTHVDADHINGVVELLECAQKENIEVSHVVVHEQSLRSEPESWKQLISAADASKTSIVGINQGDCIQSNSLKLTCLYPLREQSGLRGNASSLVLRLENGVKKEYRQNDREEAWTKEYMQEGYMQEERMREEGMREEGMREECMREESMQEESMKEEPVFSALFTGDLEVDGETLLLQEYAGKTVSGITNAERERQLSKAAEEECAPGKAAEEECAPGKAAEEECAIGKAIGEEKWAETVAKEEWMGKCDLLKVGHHGSSSSSSADFLNWTSARIAFISCGQENPYGHPHAETIKRLQDAGAYILTTPENGAVKISLGLRGEIKMQKWGSG